MMLVLVGMVGLGLDAGRAYVDRRELQDAVDAAALATADAFQYNGSGHSLDVSGASNITVTGDILSSGDINITSANATVKVAGNVADKCPNPPPSAIQYECYPSGATPPCTLPDVLGSGTGAQTQFP